MGLSDCVKQPPTTCNTVPKRSHLSGGQLLLCSHHRYTSMVYILTQWVKRHQTHRRVKVHIWILTKITLNDYIVCSSMRNFDVGWRAWAAICNDTRGRWLLEASCKSLKKIKAEKTELKLFVG